MDKISSVGGGVEEPPCGSLRSHRPTIQDQNDVRSALPPAEFTKGSVNVPSRWLEQESALGPLKVLLAASLIVPALLFIGKRRGDHTLPQALRV
jgi:hypothetical protein